MNGEALAELLTRGGAPGYLGAMLLGLTMGLTACTVTCLPFMGTWVLGRASGRRDALRHTLAFIAGRVLAYALLGGLAGSLGASLTQLLAGGIGQQAIGLASVLAGSWLLLPLLRRELAGAPALATASQPITLHPRGHPPGPVRGCATRSRAGLPPLLLGLALSLTPCAPLGWLLGISALAGSPWHGLGHGLAFGLGAAVTPLLLLLPAFGAFGRALQEDRQWLRFWLQLVAGAVLLFLGCQRLGS